MKKILLIPILTLLLLGSFPLPHIYAQDSVQNTGDDSVQNSDVGVKFTIPNPFKKDVVGDSLFGLMKAIVDNIILPVGAVLCVLAFIYAGFLFVMAGGDTSKIKTARTALLYAAIGTAILLGSWVLANAICHTINLLGGPVCPA